MSSQERNPCINVPAEAVGDAMMVAQSYFMDSVLSNPEAYWAGSDQSTDEISENLYEKLTKDGCILGSARAIFHLTEKYSHVFPRLALIQSEEPKNPFVHDTWRSHTLFLAQDMTDSWFAGSPANHKPWQNDSPLLKVFSGDLPHVVKTFSAFYGGDWPEPEAIAATLNDRYVSPRVSSFDFPDRSGISGNITTLTHKPNGYTMNWRQAFFLSKQK